MFDWEDLRHFAALARERSLSGAARQLNVDHATVARRVAALEASLGLKLVDRRPRATALTADGERIAALTARMEEEAYAVERAARAAQPGPGGEVVVSAPPTVANTLIAPQLAALHARHPGIRLCLIGEKRTASLSRREADLAIRLSRPTEGRLVARRIGAFKFALYASPRYLAAVRSEAFGFIGYDESLEEAPQQRWLYEVAGNRPIVLRTSDLEGQVAAARAGLGVAALPTFLGDGDAGLSRLDVAARPIAREVWLVVHADLKRAPAVRAVMDFLVDCLRAGVR
jgi:DNA-binding transcriptional LysR family regulator